MLNRKIYKDLLQWKNTKQQECLVIHGARQVGKTFIAEEFGRREYMSFVSVNFRSQPAMQAIFAGAPDADSIYAELTSRIHVKFAERSTLLFFDEIQECPHAYEALRALAKDDRYDILAAEATSASGDERPDTAYIRMLRMHALDFEEYLWARGVKESEIAQLQEHFAQREPLPADTMERFQKYLREFAALGGMPTVVNRFLVTGNFNEGFAEQRNILKKFRLRVRDTARPVEAPKIDELFLSIPRQLDRDYTKFQYSLVEEGAKGRKFAGALDFLEDAGVAQPVPNLNEPEMPLAGHALPSQFKFYMTDIGLLTAMFGEDTQRAILTNDLKGPSKGGIFENLAFDLLNKRGKNLFYYKKHDSTQEIEFFFEGEDGVVPMEVKSKYGPTISMGNYIEEYEPKLAYKLIDGNISVDGPKVTMPHFMAMFL